MKVAEFQEVIWEKGRELYRAMPWRQDTRPYYVLVSEIMLQQTQVERVIPKFNAFITAFPDIVSLARAPLAEVLSLWSGLGYNRRARFLHMAAQKIVDEYDGVFPKTQKELCTLPGVGVNTAGAIMAYSYNEPVVFIETNVRTVCFYHFFEVDSEVSDKEIGALVERTLDREHPREWYWALMDYGSYLKRQGAGQNHKSKHYKKQAPLKGSLREMRGRIVRVLTAGDMSLEALKIAVEADERFSPAFDGLVRDMLIAQTANIVHLTRT